MTMQDQINKIEALISKATSGLSIGETLDGVNAWNAFAKAAIDNAAALEAIKAEQVKLGGKLDHA